MRKTFLSPFTVVSTGQHCVCFVERVMMGTRGQGVLCWTRGQGVLGLVCWTMSLSNSAACVFSLSCRELGGRVLRLATNRVGER